MTVFFEQGCWRYMAQSRCAIQNQDASLRFEEAHWRERKHPGPRIVGPLQVS